MLIKPFSREEGIQAIISLQAMAGINESEESAEKGWNGLSLTEQESTISAYRLFCKK